MVRRDTPWPAGTPCWVDLKPRDLERTKAFYHELFGWEYHRMENTYGGYTVATLDGLPVAGLLPKLPELPSWTDAWTVYLATNDIHDTDFLAIAAGAVTILPPSKLGSLAWVGYWVDSARGMLAAWQADELPGFAVVNEPGAVAWCDFRTIEIDVAQTFYARTFDYTYTEIGEDEYRRYSVFSVPGSDEPVGGLGCPALPEDGIDFDWAVRFQVDDVDQAADIVESNGGVVKREPRDFPFGRMMMAGGPDWERFCLITPKAKR